METISSIFNVITFLLFQKLSDYSQVIAISLDYVIKS